MNESSKALHRCVTSAVIEPTLFTTDISLHRAVLQCYTVLHCLHLAAQWRKVKQPAAVLHSVTLFTSCCTMQCYNVVTL